MLVAGAAGIGHHLYCNVAAEDSVRRKIDDAHGTPTQFPADFVVGNGLANHEPGFCGNNDLLEKSIEKATKTTTSEAGCLPSYSASR
jgi:hypothetical protein